MVDALRGGVDGVFACVSLSFAVDSARLGAGCMVAFELVSVGADEVVDDVGGGDSALFKVATYSERRAAVCAASLKLVSELADGVGADEAVARVTACSAGVLATGSVRDSGFARGCCAATEYCVFVTDFARCGAVCVLLVRVCAELADGDEFVLFVSVRACGALTTCKTMRAVVCATAAVSELVCMG